MKKKEAEQFEEINKRLDAIINILLRHNQLQEMTTREHIEILNSVGLRDAEIARILGRTRGYVAGELSKMKSRGAKLGGE